MERDHPPDSDMGRLLHVWSTPKGVLVDLVGKMAVFVLVFGGIGVLIVWQGSGRNSGVWQGGVVLLTIVVLVLAVTAKSALELLHQVEFREHGAISKPALGAPRAFWYDGASGLSYRVVRTFHDGGYHGTFIHFRLRDADGRVLKKMGRHKERLAKGNWRRVVPTFTGEDEMDTIREVIAARVAETMSAEIQRAGSARWTPRATLTDRGVVPAKGRCRGQLVPYGEIEIESAPEGAALRRRGERRVLLRVDGGGENFFPGLFLVDALCAAAAERG